MTSPRNKHRPRFDDAPKGDRSRCQLAGCAECGEPLEFPQDEIGRSMERCTNRSCSRFAINFPLGASAPVMR